MGWSVDRTFHFYLFIYLFIYYLFIHSFIYLFIYLFILIGEKKVNPERKCPSINQLKREKTKY